MTRIPVAPPVPWPAAYGVALLAVAVSLAFRLALQPWLGMHVPYMQFFPAIMVTAWIAGPGPAAAATLLSTLVAMYFFLPPDGFAVGDSSEQISLPLYVATGLGIAGLTHLLRGAEAAHRTSAALALTRAERLDAIVRTAVDGIIVIDTKGEIEAFNGGAARLFGYAEHEVVGRNVSLLMPSPDREAHDRYLARYLETGQKQIIGIGRQVAGRRCDGTTFPLHLSVGEMIIGGERKFTGILHDLSVREQIEARLREQTALARLGEMAAVVAHEVKNPLAGVRGAIQVLGTRLPADSRDAGIVKEIVTRIDALNALMTDLLLFARPPQPRPAPVEVGALVAATAALLRQDPTLRDVRVDVDACAPRIEADANLLEIVFLNLLVNAAHAMQGHGVIRVTVTRFGSMCHVAFTDSGPGIPPELREQIFKPFFTTKARGSGLGLATARSLVEAHHGRIVIECPTTGGTTVSVQLPFRPSDAGAA